MVLKTIDAHVSGAAIRFIVSGLPAAVGQTMVEKAEWLEQQCAAHCRMAVREPRGHLALCGALLTEPVAPGSHCGVLCFDADGPRLISGEGVMAAVAIALQRGFLTLGRDVRTVAVDVPFATVEVTVANDAAGRGEDGEVGSTTPSTVRYVGMPMSVLAGGLEVTWGARTVRADLVHGGELYAIVDSESAGVAGTERDLAHAGAALAGLLDQSHAKRRITSEPVAALMFTGLANAPEAQLRTMVTRRRGIVERSASVAGLGAVMAVLDAMGLMVEQSTVTLEGPTGTMLSGSVLRRTAGDAQPAIVPALEARVWITGEHTLIAAADDPLREGAAFDRDRFSGRFD